MASHSWLRSQTVHWNGAGPEAAAAGHRSLERLGRLGNSPACPSQYTSIGESPHHSRLRRPCAVHQPCPAYRTARNVVGRLLSAARRQRRYTRGPQKRTIVTVCRTMSLLVMVPRIADVPRHLMLTSHTPDRSTGGASEYVNGTAGWTVAPARGRSFRLTRRGCAPRVGPAERRLYSRVDGRAQAATATPGREFATAPAQARPGGARGNLPLRAVPGVLDALLEAVERHAVAMHA